MLSTLFCFATSRHHRHHIETYGSEENSYISHEPKSVLYKVGVVLRDTYLYDGYNSSTNERVGSADKDIHVQLLEMAKPYGDYYKATRGLIFGYILQKNVLVQDYQESYVSMAGKLGRKMIDTAYSKDGRKGKTDEGMINYLYTSVGFNLNMTMSELYKLPTTSVNYCRLGDVVLYGNGNFKRASIIIGKNSENGSDVILQGTEKNGFVEVDKLSLGDFFRCVAVTNNGYYY